MGDEQRERDDPGLGAQQRGQQRKRCRDRGSAPLISAPAIVRNHDSTTPGLVTSALAVIIEAEITGTDGWGRKLHP